MIVLPSSFERYLAALRNFVSLSVFKYGLTPRHLKNLKKIYKAEAFYHKSEVYSLDINEFCKNLLRAVSAFREDLKFSITADGNLLVNQKLLTHLILTICCFSDYLKITEKDGFLLILFYGKSEKILRFINAMSGTIFYEQKTEASLIVIPASKTSQSSVPILSEWDFLFDSFSAVNVYFATF